MDNRNDHYNEDRKYIHETLEHTKKHLGKIDEKFEQFKVDTTKDIAVIQTKLAYYATAISTVVGIVVSYISHILKGN